jgi:phage repressor protein C with HTH and peptisase S24 domain
MIGKDQIRHIMNVRGWKQLDFSIAIGVSQSTISRWLSGQQQPDAQQQEILKELLAQNMEELPDFTDVAPVESAVKPVVRGMIRHREDKEGRIREYDLRAGASYGGGYAIAHVNEDGEPTANHEAVKAEWVIPPSFLKGELRLSSDTTDIVAIDGPSMVPDLMPSDRVLIDRSHRDPRQGGIFAVREDDGIIVKHVEVIRGSDPLRIVCKSSNPTYTPFELILDGENVAIIGRVAGRISRM